VTDDCAYYAMEVKTCSPSSRVIVASFLRAAATRGRSLGRRDHGIGWRSTSPLGLGSERLGKQSGSDYLPEGDDVMMEGRGGGCKEHDTVSTMVISHQTSGRRSTLVLLVRSAAPVSSLLKSNIIPVTRK